MLECLSAGFLSKYPHVDTFTHYLFSPCTVSEGCLDAPW